MLRFVIRDPPVLSMDQTAGDLMRETSKREAERPFTEPNLLFFSQLRRNIEELRQDLDDYFLITSEKISRIQSIAQDELIPATATPALRRQLLKTITSLEAISDELSCRKSLNEQLTRLQELCSELLRERQASDVEASRATRYLEVLPEVMALMTAQFIRLRNDYRMTTLTVKRALTPLCEDSQLLSWMGFFILNMNDYAAKALASFEKIICDCELLAGGYELVCEDRRAILLTIKESYTVEGEQKVFEWLFEDGPECPELPYVCGWDGTVRASEQ